VRPHTAQEDRTMQTLDLDRKLRLHPLVYLEEGDEVTVGRADINSYGLFPVDGAALLRQLEAGSTPNEAARWYSAQYGENVDIGEFLEVLEEYELIVKDGETVSAPAPVKWQRLGRAVFSPVAFACYAVLVVAAGVVMIREPSLAPSYRHLFFTPSLVAVTLGLFLGQAPWILLHEAFHALAGRRLGLNSTLRIGRRFYYIVFVTTLDGLVTVPRRKRYLPMLAGLLLDVLVVSGLTLAAAALQAPGGVRALLARFLLAMALGVLLRMVWQGYFFLRTDLYYLITTVLGCNDLHTTAHQMLANRLNTVLGRRNRLVDESTWHPRDRSVARWYVWLMLLGYAALVVTLITVAIPAGIRFAEQVVHQLVIAPTARNVLDAGVFLGLNFWEPALVVVLAIRGFRSRRLSRASA
jgi:hypothetical protein